MARIVLALVAGMLMAGGARASSAPQPAPAADTQSSGPTVQVDNFTLIDRAPVRNGFSPFSIEATGLLPAPRKRESFTPSEDDRFYTLRRTVERFLQRKENAVGWSRSNEANIAFGSELGRFRSADGIAYAVEGELVLRGTTPLPMGLSLTAPAGAPPLRYSAGLMAADQVLMLKEGMLDAANPNISWMLSLRPNGPDAAIPVRAVFAVRAEGEDADANRKALAGVNARLMSSKDGRAAQSERPTDAAQWLKPPPVYLKPGDIPGAEGAKPAKPEKAKKGGH